MDLNPQQRLALDHGLTLQRLHLAEAERDLLRAELAELRVETERLSDLITAATEPTGPAANAPE